MKPLSLFGAPVCESLFLQVIAPVEMSGIDIAIQGIAPLRLALERASLSDQPLK